MNFKYIDITLIEPLKAIERQSGKPIISTLVDIYLNESPGLLSKMEKAFKESDFATFGRSAHSLKSSSAYLGAREVRDICKILENLSLTSEDKDLRKIEVKFSELVETLMGTVEELKVLFREK